MKRYSFFIAGIIQGSIPRQAVHPQDYRAEIRRILHEHFPACEVYCPFENHPASLSYDDAKASSVFFDHIRMVEKTDCLVTFLPEASMGTAVEMYAAREAGRAVVTISPLSSNWTVKFLSDRLFAGTPEFEEFAASGRLRSFLDEFYAKKA